MQDCVDLLEAVLSAHGAGVSTGPAALTPTSLGHLHFDRGMLAIYGGSHGGFLTAHLIGARGYFLVHAECHSVEVLLGCVCILRSALCV